MRSEMVTGILAGIREMIKPFENANPEDIPAIRGAMPVPEETPPLPPDVTVTETNANGVPALWVQAEGTDPDIRFVRFHGGGYVLGGPGADNTAPISREGNCVVLDVDYRLAPEHTYPAALEDALNAIQFARDNGPLGPSTAKTIFVGGDSAGGGLALAALIALRDKGAELPSAAVTMSAWTDLSLSGTSMDERDSIDPMLGRVHLDIWGRAYVGDADLTTPLASPLFADLSGLPPLLMQVGTDEVLFDDTIRVAEKAQEAGVSVRTEIYGGQHHVFQNMAALIPEGNDAYASIGAFLKRHA